MQLLLWIIFFLGCLQHHIAKAQQYDFRQYSIEQGLPQSQVLALLKDHRGLIWGSTYGGGFFRFEGKKFLTVNRQTTPMIGSITAMCFSTADDLYLVTENGSLWKYDGHHYLCLDSTYKKLIPVDFSAASYALYYAPNGYFFLQIMDREARAQLLLYDGVQFKNYTTQFQQNFLHITVTPSKDVWLSTSNKGVFLLQNDQLLPAPFGKHPIMGKEMPFVVGATQRNELLVAAISPMTQSSLRATPRLYKYSQQHFKPIPLPTSITNYLEQGLGFFEDSKGTLWIFHPNNWDSEFGVWRYKDKQFTHFHLQNGLPNNNILKVIEDNEGNIWMASSGTGLVRFSGEKFLHFTKQTGLADEVVWQFWQAPNKTVYIGTSAGIGKYQQQQFQFLPFKPNEHLTTSMGNKHYTQGLLAIHTDNQYQKGMQIFDTKEQMTPLAAHLGLPKEFSEVALVGYKDTALVLSTKQGVVLYHNKKKYITEAQDSLLGRFRTKKYLLKYLGTDKKGHEWFQRVQNNELVVYMPQQLRTDQSNLFHTQLAKHQATPLVKVSKMLADRSGRNWFITIDNGIYVIENQKVIHLTPEQGLSSLACYEILEDRQGNIWVGTQKGIDKITWDTNGTVKVRKYGKYEGFFGEETNGGAAMEDQEGNLWFGHIKGATKYNPKEDVSTTVAPQVFLTAIKLFAKNVNWLDSTHRGLHQGMNKWFDVPQELCLPYHTNHISFDFTALYYTNPEKVVFQWKLEGAYNDWLPITDKTEAVFTNLPAGSYTFWLRAANGEGQWTPQPIAYKFRILPPFWATWWFRGLGIMTVLLATYAFTKWRLRKIEAEKAALDELIKLRTLEIKQQRDELAQQKDNLSALNQAMASQKEEIETQRDKIEKSLQDLQILSDIVRDITATLDTKQIISTIYQRINVLMKAEGFGIGLYNKEQHCLDFEGYIENGQELPFHQDSLHTVACFSVWCYVHQQEIVMNDVEAEFHQYLPDRQPPKVGENLHAVIYLPLLTCEKIVGVITVQSFSRYAYNDQHLTLLRNIASYAATALDNASAYKFIAKQQKEIATKNEDITASISYALRIQQSMLPLEGEIAQIFPQHFIFFQPKDIVSGDFYWLYTLKNTQTQVPEMAIMVVADCTGHGVPGAMMSMIGNSLLNKIIIDKNITQPSSILEELHQSIRVILKQDTTDSRDGMDLALISYQLATKTLTFAGARNPIYLVFQNEQGATVLEHLKADKNPIGGFQYEQHQRTFTQQTVTITTPTNVYLFSDGYQDQFSKDNARKFMSKRMRELFVSIYAKEMFMQKQIIQQTMQVWKGDTEQLDDMLVVGIHLD